MIEIDGVSQPHDCLPWFLNDMLPMLYAPINGELVGRNFASRTLQPTTATLTEWPRAKELAGVFWRVAAQDERISAGFQAIALENLGLVDSLWCRRVGLWQGLCAAGQALACWIKHKKRLLRIVCLRH